MYVCMYVEYVYALPTVIITLVVFLVNLLYVCMYVCMQYEYQVYVCMYVFVCMYVADESKRRRPQNISSSSSEEARGFPSKY